MQSRQQCAQVLIAVIRPVLGAPVVRSIALLGLCAAYLQGGINKLADFPGAVAEMQHFGLSPAAPMAVLVIGLELGASALILIGVYRWVGAVALAAFTLMATFIANRFWENVTSGKLHGGERILRAPGAGWRISVRCLARYSRTGTLRPLRAGCRFSLHA